MHHISVDTCNLDLQVRDNVIQTWLSQAHPISAYTPWAAFPGKAVLVDKTSVSGVFLISGRANLYSQLSHSYQRV
jgi:hypothetical protein